MSYSKEQIDYFNNLSNMIYEEYYRVSMKNIKSQSCYSDAINMFIRSVEELNIYEKEKFEETYITRPALISRIDISFMYLGKSNLDRMLSGLPPAELTEFGTQVYDLHHIGQKYESPFAELPHTIHSGINTYSILHDIGIES